MQRTSISFILFFLFVAIPVLASESNSEKTIDARGFADDRGGRGGEVIRVTNLEPRGPGSLRAALEADGPRIIVFEVGGYPKMEMTRRPLDVPDKNIEHWLSRMARELE